MTVRKEQQQQYSSREGAAKARDEQGFEVEREREREREARREGDKNYDRRRRAKNRTRSQEIGRRYVR